MPNKAVLALKKFGPFTYERVGVIRIFYGLGYQVQMIGSKWAFGKMES